MELHLELIGTTLVLLALVHAIFPRYFNWKTDLAPLSLVNRQMMHVHTFFVAFTVLLMGIFCLTSTDDIIHTRIGKQLALGLAIFWGVRLVFQFVVYSPALWRGKPFETVMHIVFASYWAYLTCIFFMIYWGNG
ncbi:hypothetical protein J2I47_23115 [Fibrella sp. HMF5335]|uniref:Uncharacterized protein n=1 Tax=Fibrella rubiginis TaxID=2817060 RepID=A0A939K5G5_9BACT|nr:hypothetical protein [Fibrella rubiginis]MBO0939459.1 hypothetical protein [Fibrella rubiginis]